MQSNIGARLGLDDEEIKRFSEITADQVASAVEL